MTGVDYPGFEAGDETVIWRYMSFERFVDLLSGELYFAAAHQFDDEFEGAITQAAQEQRQMWARELYPDDADMQQSDLDGDSWAFAELRRLTKVSCWHARATENVAMWERYRSNTGAGVAVASTVGALKRSLQEFRLKPTYGEERIMVGRVHYIDYAHDHMTDSSMLGIFLYKRIEYEDEREVRALLSLRMAEEFAVPVPDDGAIVSVDPVELIHQVRAFPKASSDNVAMITEATRCAGLACPVRRSKLDDRPVY